MSSGSRPDRLVAESGAAARRSSPVGPGAQSGGSCGGLCDRGGSPCFADLAALAVTQPAPDPKPFTEGDGVVEALVPNRAASTHGTCLPAVPLTSFGKEQVGVTAAAGCPGHPGGVEDGPGHRSSRGMQVQPGCSVQP